METMRMGESTAEKPKKKFKIGIEMECGGKDGQEIVDGDLWETVEVEAVDEDEARDIVFNKMDFGNRRPNGYSEVEEIKTATTQQDNNLTNQQNAMNEQMPTSHQEEVKTPDELKQDAMHELGYAAHERQFRLDRGHVEKIVAGWELLDEEVKKLAIASFPDVAIALLDAKIN